MNTKYFASATNLQDLKTAYKKLALENHPDLNSSPDATRTMQEINEQYAGSASRFIAIGCLTRADEQHAAGKKVNTDFVNLEDVIEMLRVKIIEILSVSKDLDIEITGTWLWVSGETKKHKTALSKLGLHWASKKGLWAFAGIKSRGRGKWSMGQIRATYGSAKLDNNRPEKVAIKA